MPMSGDDIVRTMVVLTARKFDYLCSLLEGLKKRTSNLRLGEREILLQTLTRAVAQMEPKLFITQAEARGKRLDSRIVLEDLNREELWRQLERQLPPETF